MKRTRKPEALSIVVVVWEDAHADSAGTWINLSDIDPEPLIVTSVGILLASEVKPGHVTLTQSHADGLCDHVIHIPEKMVKEITVLGAIDITID